MMKRVVKAKYFIPKYIEYGCMSHIKDQKALIDDIDLGSTLLHYFFHLSLPGREQSKSGSIIYSMFMSYGSGELSS